MQGQKGFIKVKPVANPFKDIMRPYIILTSNTAWSMWNFRQNLLEHWRDQSNQEVWACPDGFEKDIQNADISFRAFSLSARGLNPLVDFLFFLRSVFALYKKKPDLLINYTIKPVIYLGLAGRVLGIPTLSVITGLGHAFFKEGFLQRLVTNLYKISQKKVRHVFFLNEADLTFFVSKKIVREDQAVLLPGEGVNTTRFAPLPLPQGPLTFLYCGRLLQEKGLDHFLEMAAHAHSTHQNMRFIVVGPQDASDPFVYKKVLEAQEQGVISYEGVHKDVRPFLEKTHFLVLLSKYREGIPRTLMEAASMARPVITTNVPGCREMVPRGTTGFLLPPNDLEALLKLCDTLAQEPIERLTAMGQEGRAHVQAHYSDSVVLAFYDRVLINFQKGVS